MTGTSERAALLHASGLGKSYGALRATKNVCIDVHGAEIHALIRENGKVRDAYLGESDA